MIGLEVEESPGECLRPLRIWSKGAEGRTMIAILWPSRFFTARAKRDWLVLVRPGDQGAFGFGRCASYWSLVLPQWVQAYLTSVSARRAGRSVTRGAWSWRTVVDEALGQARSRSR